MKLFLQTLNYSSVFFAKKDEEEKLKQNELEIQIYWEFKRKILKNVFLLSLRSFLTNNIS